MSDILLFFSLRQELYYLFWFILFYCVELKIHSFLYSTYQSQINTEQYNIYNELLQVN